MALETTKDGTIKFRRYATDIKPMSDEVDWGVMDPRCVRTATEMQIMQKEAGEGFKAMHEKMANDLGEGVARQMEKMTVETMNRGTMAIEITKDGTIVAGGPYPHSTTGGYTRVSRGPSDHTHELPDAPPNTGTVGVQTWTKEEMQVLVTSIVNEAVAHLVSEIDGLTQRCQELEIELEIEQNKFMDNEWEEFEPKRRGNF
jgi:hypothetical protein